MISRTLRVFFDRGDLAPLLKEAEAERQRVREEFPLEEWPDLPLERYALGAGGRSPTYCQLLERETDVLGSIKGGSAAKLILFRHSSGEWRLPPPLRGMEPQTAWEQVRREFHAALEAVAQERFDTLDDLETLVYGQALVTKTLATYFPQQFLPIYSANHVRHFIELLGGERYRTYGGVRTWRANRQLRRIVSERTEFAGWDPMEVMHFLYEHFDPRQHDRTIWKIAPDRQAKRWGECVEGSFICVGWDEVGDLTQYESDADLRKELTAHWPESEGNHVRLARQLLRYRDLDEGDLIVANRGKSEVLALGTVSGGYRYEPERPEFRHLVPVDWDESYAQTLDEPENTWQPTFAKVRPSLLQRLTAHRSLAAKVPAPEPELPADVHRLLDALDLKGQVILHGPPGTGKTRLALSAALALAGEPGAIEADPGVRDEAVRQLLPHPGTMDPASCRVRLVTFHPSYGYEDFVEGFKPDLAAGGNGLTLRLANGLFYDLCTSAAQHPDQTFLLIIDEINRGDLPRIFGELITLLEPDKRGLPVSLPVSSRSFAIPPNIKLIGTMNTVDRSVGHLDAALSRRFAFLEVAPDPEVVDGSVGPLDLADFLQAINSRITKELDTEHQIGHAYLLREHRSLVSEEEVAAAFYHNIVPLLTDYSLGRTDLLHQLLGDLVDETTGTAVSMAPLDLVAALAAEFTAPSQPDSGPDGGFDA
ncbi:AAA family ATPase [Saccharopolyspora sp. SCSIO 74807]|uniref:McrB family protein n=1 Tax=Saccharopolyspora sp. SCSIO 74807 TaxID=3118084 RepID=UPI0030CBE150